MRPVQERAKQQALPREMRRPLGEELRLAEQAAPNEDARRRAARPVIEARKDEITITLAEQTADKFLKRRLHYGILGMEYDPNTRRHEVRYPPLFDGVQLQSLLRRADGTYADITYRSGMERLNNRELKDLRLMYGPDAADDIRLCEVDPQTGLFREKLPVIEALKCLREHGEGFRRPRWARAGSACYFDGALCADASRPHQHDRWIVREVRHYALYGSQGPSHRGVVPRTVVASSEPVRYLGPDEAIKVRTPEEAEQARR